jgi:tripartite-type tricarboxylate transporter receptor subunit TctC
MDCRLNANRGWHALTRSFFATGMLLLATTASAQTIKLIVPTPAGGAGDILARVLADQVGRVESAAIVVENRPGGSTLIGTEAVARAAPDGSTLLIAGNSFLINPHLRKTNYDPLTSFEPICNLVSLPTVVVVKSSSPYKTLRELLSAAQDKPGQLTLASIGPASVTHIASEMLKRIARAEMTFVPFPGTAPALNALMGDHVTSFFGNYAEVSQQLNAGTLRALASTSPARIEQLPHLPTLTELGYRISVGDIWYGLVAPAKTPRSIVSRLERWFVGALKTPDVNTKLVANGIYPAVRCGADHGAYLREQLGEYGRAIREADIKS